MKISKTQTLFGQLRRREDGGALVEACLTLPLLVMLILGAAEFSRVAYTSLEVVSAAKAGVAYGAQSYGLSNDADGITLAATTDAANIPNLQVATPTSSFACSDGVTPATGANTDCKNSHIIQTLTVQTSAQLTPLIHVPGMPSTYTITGSASQVCLQ